MEGDLKKCLFIRESCFFLFQRQSIGCNMRKVCRWASGEIPWQESGRGERLRFAADDARRSARHRSRAQLLHAPTMAQCRPPFSLIRLISLLLSSLTVVIYQNPFNILFPGANLPVTWNV